MDHVSQFFLRNDFAAVIFVLIVQGRCLCVALSLPGERRRDLVIAAYAARWSSDPPPGPLPRPAVVKVGSSPAALPRASPLAHLKEEGASCGCEGRGAGGGLCHARVAAARGLELGPQQVACPGARSETKSASARSEGSWAHLGAAATGRAKAAAGAAGRRRWNLGPSPGSPGSTL